MDKRLSKYLQTVESELRGLPEQQREAELREMRQHLEAIVARLMEGGLSEEEAVEAACAQFGRAHTIVCELRWASPRGETTFRAVLAPLAALLCNVVLYPIVVGLTVLWLTRGQWSSSLFFYELQWGAWTNWWFEKQNTTLLVIYAASSALHWFVSPFVSGWIAGRIAPRGGVLGTASLYAGLAGALYLCASAYPFIGLGHSLVFVVLSASLSAWLASSRTLPLRLTAKRKEIA